MSNVLPLVFSKSNHSMSRTLQSAVLCQQLQRERHLLSSIEELVSAAGGWPVSSAISKAHAHPSNAVLWFWISRGHVWFLQRDNCYPTENKGPSRLAGDGPFYFTCGSLLESKQTFFLLPSQLSISPIFQINLVIYIHFLSVHAPGMYSTRFQLGFNGQLIFLMVL